MELISYVLTSLIVSLGIFCGVGLGWVAKEELKPGARYLVLFQNILAVLILAFVIYLKQTNLIVISAILAFGIIYRTRLAKAPKTSFYFIVYVVLALIFSGSFKQESFAVISSLIFLFGFPTGSLIFMKKGWLKNSAYFAFVFFAVANIAYFTISRLLV